MIRLGDVLKVIKELLGTSPDVVTSAPGRLDFLNTHQDYKGLPVVGVGVDLRCFIGIKEVGGDGVEVMSENLRREGLAWRDSFSSKEPALRGGGWFGDYFRAVIKVFRDEGIDVPGMKVVVFSEVPVASGLASSAALEVALAWGINELVGAGLGRKEVAELAYRAEHDVMGIPCGRLDQYTSVFGGITYIETRAPYNVEHLSFSEGVFTVADSGIRHSTAEVHPRRQAEIDEGLKELLKLDLPEGLRSRLHQHYWGVAWSELSEEELRPYLIKLPEVPRKRILYTLRAHRTTLIALRAMKGEPISEDEFREFLGIKRLNYVEKLVNEGIPKGLAIVSAVINYQHELLRDLYDVSLPELERIRDAALRAGALGCKLSGAGLGGSLIALNKDYGVAEEVAMSCKSGGAVSALVVNYDEGTKVDYRSK